jgi:hypothetical protein
MLWRLLRRRDTGGAGARHAPGTMTIWTSGEYLFIAPLAASTPSPMTPPRMRLPAAIPSMLDASTPAPSW